MKHFAYIFFMSAVIFSCTFTNKDAISPKNEPRDSLQIIPKYSVNVKPILNYYSCLRCHSESNASLEGAGIALEPFENLLVFVKNGSLYGSMAHTGSWSPMPKGGDKATPNELKVIKTWIENGAKND
jgi:hypothetical protein